MIKANALIEKAKTSRFYLNMLNFVLSRIVPFNRPHFFRIISISDNEIKVNLPYRRVNLNHLKGLHACALATLAEFTSGVLLLNLLDTNQYRMLIKNLHMEYHYQCKSEALAFYSINEETVKSNIIEPLRNQDSIELHCEVKIKDKAGNHVCTGKVNWQIKSWNKVKTT